MIQKFVNLPKGETPKTFTYPFNYTPDAFAKEAMEELCAKLTDFPKNGKMLGVLVVRQNNNLAFLAAYSGATDEKIENNYSDLFVPSIFQLPKNSIPNTPEESKTYQDYIFSQYEMLNISGEKKNLLDIFAETPLKYPPSGSGDCCAPKLLQYAFSHSLQPVCMAEFWWGESPKHEIRHHRTFYPACQGRCKPILGWMLKGMNIDRDPMDAENKELEKQLSIVYEDDWLLIVNKPSGMLSVPGKIKAPCVTENERLKSHCPNKILVPVHRLDMLTSGLQILLKEESEYKKMQDCFVRREVKKHYLALLDGVVKQNSGKIDLPLSSDYLNRPAQRIDKEKGKKAITYFEVVKREGGKTLINLFPHTGRTHQLRVHCAANEGLGCPIVGDTLYGKTNTSNSRLCLHALAIDFEHPVTGEKLHITTPLPDFCPNQLSPENLAL